MSERSERAPNSLYVRKSDSQTSSICERAKRVSPAKQPVFLRASEASELSTLFGASNDARMAHILLRMLHGNQDVLACWHRCSSSEDREIATNMIPTLYLISFRTWRHRKPVQRCICSCGRNNVSPPSESIGTRLDNLNTCHRLGHTRRTGSVG